MPEMVAVRDLVMDPALYPRLKINTFNISKYASALRGGHTPPPVVADRVSRVVTDGWHRCHAALEVSGEDATVPIEWRDYTDRAAMFVDAVRLNEHGQPLSGQERAMVAQRLETEFHLEPRAISFVLQTDERTVLRLVPRWAQAPDADGTAPGQYAANGRTRIALKHGTRRLRGQELTPEQIEAHEHMGVVPMRAVAQVITALTGDLFDWDKPATRERLCLLLRELQSALDVRGVQC